MYMREIKGYKKEGEFVVFETYEDGIKEYCEKYDEYVSVNTTKYFKIKRELLKDLIRDFK